MPKCQNTSENIIDLSFIALQVICFVRKMWLKAIRCVVVLFISIIVLKSVGLYA